MSEGPHDRLKTAREAAGYATPADAARAHGWAPPTYFGHENGSRGIRTEAGIRYGRAFDVDAGWILTGEGRGPASRDGMPPRDIVRRRSSAPETVIVHGQEFSAIPVYDIRAAAGAGAENHHEEPLTWAVYRVEWLRRVSRSPGELSVIRVTGDSMRPTLHDGDTVLVDRSVRAVGRDAIYIIQLGADIQCKRCSRHPTNGLLTIASDNPAYPTYSGIKPDGLRVLGRVIWTGRGI